MHVRDLAAALRKKGEEVIVLAGGNGFLFNALQKEGVECRKLEKLVHPIRPIRDLAALAEIRAQLKRINPDLVTTHSNKAGLLGRMTAKTLKIPVIHTSHGFLFSGRESSTAGYFFRLIEKLASGAAANVITVANSEYRLAEKLGLIAPTKMTVVHNGLPDLAFPVLAEPEINPPQLIMVARFSAPKDQQTLIKALGMLKDFQWRLTLVGEGSGRQVAEQLVEKLDLAGRVTFTGMLTESATADQLANSQIFILSSRREGFPLSVLEAMRAGLPVVAADIGGVSEAVLEGESGLLFFPGDTVSLAEKISTLLKDPVLRKEMGYAGRERFLRYFTLDQMVEKTLTVYKKVTISG